MTITLANAGFYIRYVLTAPKCMRAILRFLDAIFVYSTLLASQPVYKKKKKETWNTSKIPPFYQALGKADNLR